MGTVALDCDLCQCQPQNPVDNEFEIINRGESGHDFIFTLTNVSTSETYVVQLEGLHPDGQGVSITKSFSVNIIPDSGKGMITVSKLMILNYLI